MFGNISIRIPKGKTEIVVVKKEPIAVFVKADGTIFVNEEEICGETLFVIQTHHKKTGKVLIRFGTTQQLYSMLNTYQYSVVKNKEQYELYMEHLSFFKLK
jgi:biopolymer transport protein ExbD